MALASGIVLSASPAFAWEVGTQLGYTGCHEPITAQALRNVRAIVATAPPIAPSRDERALFDDVQFEPPADLVDDVAGMSLLLGVRDNDLKGENPLNSLDVVEVHGDPTTQDEHCIRAPEQDGAEGAIAALEACRRFIHTRATEALAGLGADGTVDANARMPLAVYVSIAGHVDPPLPLFYVKMGQALHALEDGFTHTYRTADRMHVTTVLNWIELAEGTLDEEIDGPPHRLELDNCRLDDPVVVASYQRATEAATELLLAALDPGMSRDAKIAAFEAVTARYFGFQPGCDATNNWCDAPEAAVTDPGGCGCRTASGADAGVLAIATVIVALGLRVRRRRPRGPAGAASVALLGGVLVLAPVSARADEPPPPQQTARADEPAVPPTPTEPEDIPDLAEGKEPGRDEKTPTVAEVREIRKDKRLGPRLGFAINAGASIARAAAVGSVGARFRIDEKWLVGLDVAWNPWITTAPLDMKAGVIEVYATGIRRFPMKYDRVNLRTTLHVGTSTLLFDVYGAPRHSTGLFLAGSILGLDYDMGGSLRLVVDPAQMAVAIPSLGGIPLWYEQFRFVIGLQYGG
jgi:MYXO-CTERM domain-containing protein